MIYKLSALFASFVLTSAWADPATVPTKFLKGSFFEAIDSVHPIEIQLGALANCDEQKYGTTIYGSCDVTSSSGKLTASKVEYPISIARMDYEETANALDMTTSG